MSLVLHGYTIYIRVLAITYTLIHTHIHYVHLLASPSLSFTLIPQNTICCTVPTNPSYQTTLPINPPYHITKYRYSDLLKMEGNQWFAKGEYRGAIECYTLALEACPLTVTERRVTYYR